MELEGTMTDDLHIENLDCKEQTGSNSSVQPGDIHDTSDAPTEGSGYSLNGSGPPTPMTDDPPKMAPEESDIKIYLPYDIEEPDDDIDTTARRLDLPYLPDTFERWQRDLVDCVDSVDDSTPTHAPTNRHFVNPRRGQKRKSAIAPAGSGYHSGPPLHRSKSNIKPGEEAVPAPSLSPKRRRRRSKLTDDSTKVTQVVSLHDFRDTEINESSSSDLWSTDASADTTHDFAVTDEMNLD